MFTDTQDVFNRWQNCKSDVEDVAMQLLLLLEDVENYSCRKEYLSSIMKISWVLSFLE